MKRLNAIKEPRLARRSPGSDDIKCGHCVYVLSKRIRTEDGYVLHRPHSWSGDRFNRKRVVYYHGPGKPYSFQVAVRYYIPPSRLGADSYRYRRARKWIGKEHLPILFDCRCAGLSLVTWELLQGV